MLHSAIVKHDLRLAMQCLKDPRINVRCQYGPKSRTLLHIAAQAGNQVIAIYLIDIGASIHDRDV
jgi:ankyrin repeat protein